MVGFLIGGFVGGLRTVLGIAALTMLIMPVGLNDRGRLLMGMMIGAMVSGLIITRFSSYKNTISQPQDGPAVLLSVFAASVAANQGPAESVVSIVIAAVALSSIFTGIVFFLIGHWQLGRLVRFIPFPVIGGFLAGSGLLITLSALSILTNQRITQIDFGLLVSSGSVYILAFGLVLTIALLKVPTFFKSRIVFPSLLVASAALLHLYFYFQQISVSELQSTGWLVAPKTKNGSDEALFWFDIPMDAWTFLANQLLTFFAIAIVSVVALLLNLSGLELATKSEFNFNKELKVSGISNILGGMLGGGVGFVSLSASLLGQQLKADGRFLGYICYGFIFIFFCFGSEVLGLVPKPVLGALLLCVGINLLVEWVIKGFKRFSKLDFMTMVFIALIMTFSGYLSGVTTGIILCAVLFVWSYSRVKVITLEVNGIDFRSNVERPFFEKELLDTHGDEIKFLRVEGFIFFGSIHSIYERIKELASSGTNYFILDLSLVKAIDSSALAVFQKITQFCNEKSVVLQFARPRKELVEMITTNDSGTAGFEYTMDRDKSLEHCENLLIHKYASEIRQSDQATWQGIEKIITSKDLLEQFKTFFSIRHYKKNQFVIRQNEVGHEMFLVESGRLEALIESQGEGSQEIRLKTFTTGAIFGETVLYSSLTRTASVRSEADAVLHVLTKDKLDEMELESPTLASALHRFVVGVMAERLSASNRLIRRLDP